LIVQGAIGISDELQDDVVEVVETIINSGIQFMIISGDRAETVMSIASNLKTD
jgi:P-type E1-E2 ATPase